MTRYYPYLGISLQHLKVVNKNKIQNRQGANMHIRQKFIVGFVIVFAFGSISFYMNYKNNISILIKGEARMLFQKTAEATSYKFRVKMEDAIKDDKIIQFYEEDIQDVENLTNGSITIKSCDIDLNEDGLVDKLVSVISPLHSGSHGDMFQILLNDESGFRDIYILNSKSNGFYDIKIVTDGNSFILRYQNDKYMRLEFH